MTEWRAHDGSCFRLTKFCFGTTETVTGVFDPDYGKANLFFQARSFLFQLVHRVYVQCLSIVPGSKKEREGLSIFPHEPKEIPKPPLNSTLYNKEASKQTNKAWHHLPKTNRILATTTKAFWTFRNKRNDRPIGPCINNESMRGIPFWIPSGLSSPCFIWV